MTLLYDATATGSAGFIMPTTRAASSDTRSFFRLSSSPATFTNPLITSRTSTPDPWVTYHQGYYYFCLAHHRAIWVWKSATLTGLDHGHKTMVWQAPPTGPYSREIWAPELMFVEGKWYIYFAASNGYNPNHRMYVLEAESDEAQGGYRLRGKLSDASDKWAIDGTVFRYDDHLYFIWSGWPGRVDGRQNLYIAPMSNPWTISGERVLLSSPDFGWEGWINEGPQVLQRDGKIFLVYSANASWTANYCLGMLSFEGGNILDRAAWRKHNRPVFRQHSGPTGQVYSTGHCSFVKSPDGSEDWLLYHGKETAAKGWPGRTTRAQKFGWDRQGYPVFGAPVPSGVALARPSGELELERGWPLSPAPATTFKLQKLSSNHRGRQVGSFGLLPGWVYRLSTAGHRARLLKYQITRSSSLIEPGPASPITAAAKASL